MSELSTERMEKVHKAVTRKEVPELAKELQEVLGQRLVAFLLKLGDAKNVGRWARREQEPHGRYEERLRDASYVVQILLIQEAPETIRAWFIGKNPRLDDQAPAEVFREDPTKVIKAARAFLAEG